MSENVPLTAGNAARYPGPMLALRGAQEDEALYPAEGVARAAGARATLAIVARGDHFYNGVEDAFAHAVCEWYSAKVAR